MASQKESEKGGVAENAQLLRTTDVAPAIVMTRAAAGHGRGAQLASVQLAGAGCSPVRPPRPPRGTRVLPRSPRGTRAPRSGRHVILFLAANPSGTTRLALDEECAAIERELLMAPGRDFYFVSKWAVSVDEVMRCFNELQPTIIHFSGHGSCGAGLHVHEDPLQPGQRRDVLAASGTGPDAGIYLQDSCVTGPALARMIATAAPSARVVVLNACFSDEIAESLHPVVECVVGMRGAVLDEAARAFAVGFYRALGNNRSVGNAVAQAIATLAAKQLPDEHLPVCRARTGICPDKLVLPAAAPR
jgi:CHAT domain